MIIQPSNVNRQQQSGTAPNGTSAWQGGSALPYLPNVASRTAEPMFYMTAYPLQFDLIQNATAQTPAGTYYEFQTLGRTLHAVQVSGTFSATVLLEGTLDDENWDTVDTITAAGIKQYSGLYASMRVSVSAFTSGSVNVSAISQRT